MADKDKGQFLECPSPGIHCLHMQSAVSLYQPEKKPNIIMLSYRRTKAYLVTTLFSNLINIIVITFRRSFSDNVLYKETIEGTITRNI